MNADRPAELINAPQSLDWYDISVWRKAQRDRCVAWRNGVGEVQRVEWGKQITTLLLGLLRTPATRVIGFCWPYQCEFDARFAIRRWCDEGATAVLPEVAGKGLPLRFRQWWPGAPMTHGVYDIPVPDGTPELRPEVLVVPMNAFDDRGYRLGYGGGYFDRTLAALKPRIVSIGVSHEHCRVPTIYPQRHDIAMDFVVTEAGVYAADKGLLASLDTEIAHAQLQKLVIGWGNPDVNQ
jgi:5-formyltetrahydrofolate cyclo-ligase